MLRIIAGSAKGRRINTPTWEGLRPTSDRLRETLFSILTPRMPEARVVDGYAGTGAIGIEALSRGAAHVTFVERDPRAVKLIRSNLERAGLESAGNACTIIRGGFVEWAGEAHETYELVLLDPPYDDPAPGDALLAAGHVLSDDGLVVLEHATRVASPDTAGALSRVRIVKAGDSSLSFYEKRNG